MLTNDALVGNLENTAQGQKFGKNPIIHSRNLTKILFKKLQESKWILVGMSVYHTETKDYMAMDSCQIALGESK